MACILALAGFAPHEFLAQRALARWALPGDFDVRVLAKNLHCFFRTIWMDNVLGTIRTML